MSVLRRWVMFLWMLISFLMGHGAKPAPVAPAAVVVPPAVVAGEPTPTCTIGLGVRRDGSRAHLVVCMIRGKQTTLGEYPTRGAARLAAQRFQAAWRAAAGR